MSQDQNERTPKPRLKTYRAFADRTDQGTRLREPLVLAAADLSLPGLGLSRWRAGLVLRGQPVGPVDGVMRASAVGWAQI